MAGCGGARTEPPNFDFAVAVEGGPSHVLSLPTIAHDYVTYLVWHHLSVQWLGVCCRSGGRPLENHNFFGQSKT